MTKDISWETSLFGAVEGTFKFLAFVVEEFSIFAKSAILSLLDILSVAGISSIEDVVVWVLSVSSLLFIIGKIGWLPERIEKAINKNQRSEIQSALEILGVKEQEVRSRFRSLKFQGSHTKDSIQRRAKDIVFAHEVKEKILVGKTNPAEENSFVDLMSASTKHAKASQMASLLKAQISLNISNVDLKGLSDFDYVATPKSGSPIIGYEFSRIVEKPLMLHSDDPKYKNKDGNSNPLAHFDVDFVPEDGKTVLIVDDSSTGGRKVKNLIGHLKELNLKVDYCVVIFEPQSKTATKQNASESLSENEVKLVSIVKHP